jgi:hypothetical protein
MAKFVNAMFLVVMLFVGHSSTTAEGARKGINFMHTYIYIHFKFIFHRYFKMLIHCFLWLNDDDDFPVLDDIGGKPDFCIAYPCCIKPPLCKPTPHDDAKAIAIDASPAPPTDSHHQ